VSGGRSSGLGRLGPAWRNSWQGLRAAWRHEQAFRQEILLVAVMVPLACWLGRTGVERALLLGVLGLILMVELMNSAVEAVVDRLGTERHPLSGRAKDLASAAVLVALLLAAMVWVVVLFT
jgi:diacylglycerol kinase (ATP)